MTCEKRTLSQYYICVCTKLVEANYSMYQTSGSCFGDSPDISTRYSKFNIRPPFVECQFLIRDFPWSSCRWAAITTMLVFIDYKVWSPLREENKLQHLWGKHSDVLGKETISRCFCSTLAALLLQVN